MEFEICVPCEDSGYEKITVEAEPDEPIDGNLDVYAKMEIGGVKFPLYVEPVFIVGDKVPLDDENQTFADCRIKNGDTLHAVLRVQEVHVTVHNVWKNETTTIDTILSTSVSRLKSIIRTQTKLSAIQFHLEQLVLESEEQYLLDVDKTLADYHIEKYNDLKLHLKPYTISVLVPTYVGLEKVVVRPDETVAALMEKITSIQEEKYWTKTKNKKMIVRGAVRDDASGTFTYMYFDLFRVDGNMIVFMDGSNGRSTKRYSHVVGYGQKMGSIYNKIESYRDRGVVDETWQAFWPKSYLFDSAWTKTFAPQIEAESSSLADKGALTLFFFPLRSKIVSLGAVDALRTLQEVKIMACRQEGVKVTTHTLVHASSEGYLNEEFRLHCYHEHFKTEYCLSLARQVERRLLGRPVMTVYVQWPSRPMELVTIASEPDETVRNLKYRIEDEMNVPLFMQKLYFVGKLLQDDSVLVSYGIRNGSAVQLLPVNGPEFLTPYKDTGVKFHDRTTSR